MKTASTSIRITPPAEILAEKISEALAPFKDALSAACKRDVELAAAAELCRPDKIKIAGDTLMGQAIHGDEKAMKQLEAAGGLDAWVASKSAVYPIKDAARHHHAVTSAELFERAAVKLIPALETAGAEIQKQFENVMAEMGELPGGLSQWGSNIQGRCNSITAAVRRAHNGEGLAWIFEQLGLAAFLKS
jgi:hypothetical protein